MVYPHFYKPFYRPSGKKTLLLFHIVYFTCQQLKLQDFALFFLAYRLKHIRIRLFETVYSDRL